MERLRGDATNKTEKTNHFYSRGDFNKLLRIKIIDRGLRIALVQDS